MTRPEHFISDAKAYRKQMVDRMATLLEWARKAAEGSKEQVEWGGRFLECRGQLAELDQMIGAWEKGWAAFRMTEELIAGGQS